MDLYVVAYGNERYNETTDKYTCQHGPEECYMNLVENCLDFYSNDDYKDGAALALHFAGGAVASESCPRQSA